ncbi:HNH endonuclease [Candidatus Pacearchaeota archaeon]|nr:HNH endonuclease [Candidatus Pacearchaeota archaeon]
MEILIFLGFIVFVLWIIFKYYKTNIVRVIDARGYYRNGYGRLVHRDVAYKSVYNYPNEHKMRFRYYDVHHIDENKTNNHPNNLQVLTRWEHKKKHGF